METEVAVRDCQRLIKIDRRWIESQLSRAVRHLTREPARRGGASERSARGRLPCAESGRAEVSVLLVNDRRMRELNLRYRGIDRPTDVLSFPQTVPARPRAKTPQGSAGCRRDLPGEPLLGDIVINLPQALRDAEAQGISLKREVSWLLVHGLLHLLGYDHEKGGPEARKMRHLERELLGALE